TGIEEGQALMRALHGRLSGLCQPTYVLDIPGGHGKSPIGPGYLVRVGGTNGAACYEVEDFNGHRHAYPPARRESFVERTGKIQGPVHVTIWKPDKKPRTPHKITGNNRPITGNTERGGLPAQAGGSFEPGVYPCVSRTRNVACQSPQSGVTAASAISRIPKAGRFSLRESSEIFRLRADARMPTPSRWF